MASAASTLGMKPAIPWDGSDESSGGGISVSADNDAIAYHLYHSNAFRSFLLRNTRFDGAVATRYGCATLYEENGELLTKLNLQIRFA